MLSISKISNFSYQVSRDNNEKTSFSKSVSYGSDSVNFGHKASSVVSLPHHLRKIFGAANRFFGNSSHVRSSKTMSERRATCILDHYHLKQRRDFAKIARAADISNLDPFYVALLGHVERYPFESGHLHSKGLLNYSRIDISNGYLLEPGTGKSVIDSNPELQQYFQRELPRRIRLNGGQTPKDLVRVVRYNGERYQITPRLIDSDKTGIALFSEKYYSY